jgi:outer membrane phospholipase A
LNINYAEGLAGKSWIEVKKVRWQRSYRDVACELTQLTASDRFWWTIGLEMEQNQTNNGDYFENIVSEIAITYRGPQLLADKSYGYPTWCDDK